MQARHFILSLAVVIAVTTAALTLVKASGMPCTLNAQCGQPAANLLTVRFALQNACLPVLAGWKLNQHPTPMCCASCVKTVSASLASVSMASARVLVPTAAVAAL